MGSFSAAHWLVVLIVVFILLGKNRLSETMTDLGKGIRSFREGLTGEDVKPEPTSIATLPMDPRSADEQT
ncbi:twin-arginine translocase TatA/TatE family subunit [Parasphingorhabdus sp.]|uniref:twin-arginine translocase TatA/TatE family subunit n=1 Tax=Parasphingorhabdus sp. TaxID=2709688 RepID=UPI002B26DFB2|nr:twin-arginine translocase TatA/TatE family subunit [Parasphingorhabdus sp.]